MTLLYGGIEAGGTKFVCGVGAGDGEVRTHIQFPTTRPDETIARALDFFRSQAEPVAAVGIGSFGPVDPDPASPAFGHITTTPKPGWHNVDLAGRVGEVLGVPVGFDTDVNAAALGEHRWGAAQDVDTFVYLTVGTGIGGGGMVAGRLIHGLIHPEMGHMLIPHDRVRDPFEGICPFHRDCLEGLASGPALEARWGRRGETLPADHPAWSLEAHYLALGLVNLITILSPRLVILGGGVMRSTQVFPWMRREVQVLLNGYVQAAELLAEGIERYVVPPGLGDRAGMLGAMALAEMVYAQQPV